MALQRSDFPIASFQEVVAALSREARAKPASPAAFGHAAALTGNHSGHRLYLLGMNQLEAGDGIEAAVPIGWRYVFAPRNAEEFTETFFAEVGQRGGSHRFSFFDTGDNARALFRGWNSAKRHPVLDTGDYELRGLRIPALLVEALWLKARHGGRDVIIPIVAGNQSLHAREAYAPAEFLGELRKLLPKRLQFARRRALRSNRAPDFTPPSFTPPSGTQLPKKAG